MTDVTQQQQQSPASQIPLRPMRKAQKGMSAAPASGTIFQDCLTKIWLEEGVPTNDQVLPNLFLILW